MWPNLGAVHRLGASRSCLGAENGATEGRCQHSQFLWWKLFLTTKKQRGCLLPPGSLQAYREVAICWASCLHFCLLFCLLFGEGVGVGVEMFLLSQSKHIEIPILSRKVSTPTPTPPAFTKQFCKQFCKQFFKSRPCPGPPRLASRPPLQPSMLISSLLGGGGQWLPVLCPGRPGRGCCWQEIWLAKMKANR